MNRPAWMTPARGFGAAACLLVLVGGYVALNALSFTRDLHWVDHSYRVLGRLERLNALEHQAVTAQRTYLLTGSRAHFDAFWQSNAESKLEAAALKGMVADNPGQAARAVQTGETLDRRLGILADVLGVYEAKGLAAAQGQIETGTGLKAQMEFDSSIAATQAGEQSLLEQRTAAMQASSRWLLATTAMGIAASLLILLFAYRALLRENRERVDAERQVTFSNRELGLTVSRLEGLSRDMESLGRYAGMLQSAFSIDEALEITRQAMAGLLPGLSGTVYLLRASKDHAEIAAAWGQPLLLSDPMPAPSDCWALRRNQPY
ncbi:MAG TPA: CHASE3 domain-containing protein, partial [Holophagaceae bacterium]|nr:CHASE3 domain-containing protein [Holophagaceae bacterium]